MEKEKMKNVLQNTSPDVLDSIKASHRFKVPQKEEKVTIWNFLKTRSLTVVAPIIVVALILVSVMNTNPPQDVIASTVTLDINPSVEITLNEDDHVINVRAVNDDGENIIDREVTYKGITLQQALNYLIDKAIEKGYIKSVDDITGDPIENVILIDVETSNQEIKERVEQAIQTNIGNKMQGLQMAYRILQNNSENLTEEQQERLEEIAQQYRISIAKLRLIQDIISLDDSYVVQDLKDLSIRELYQLKETLEGTDSTGNGGN